MEKPEGVEGELFNIHLAFENAGQKKKWTKSKRERCMGSIPTVKSSDLDKSYLYSKSLFIVSPQDKTPICQV